MIPPAGTFNLFLPFPFFLMTQRATVRGNRLAELCPKGDANCQRAPWEPRVSRFDQRHVVFFATGRKIGGGSD